MGPELLESVYLGTTRMDIHQMVRQLNSHLGPTLVASLANVRDRKLPAKWAQPDGPEPRPESIRRLQAAHRVLTAICMQESDHVARAWFIGANPRLDEEAPILALREGRVADVLRAARAFTEGCSRPSSGAAEGEAQTG